MDEGREEALRMQWPELRWTGGERAMLAESETRRERGAALQQDERRRQGELWRKPGMEGH
jgi:hypothetical protein